MTILMLRVFVFGITINGLFLSFHAFRLFSPQTNLTLKFPSWRKASVAAARPAIAFSSPWPCCWHPACFCPSGRRRSRPAPLTRPVQRASYLQGDRRGEDVKEGVGPVCFTQVRRSHPKSQPIRRAKCHLSWEELEVDSHFVA